MLPFISSIFKPVNLAIRLFITLISLFFPISYCEEHKKEKNLLIRELTKKVNALRAQVDKYPSNDFDAHLEDYGKVEPYSYYRKNDPRPRDNPERRLEEEQIRSEAKAYAAFLQKKQDDARTPEQSLLREISFLERMLKTKRRQAVNRFWLSRTKKF